MPCEVCFGRAAGLIDTGRQQRHCNQLLKLGQAVPRLGAVHSSVLLYPSLGCGNQKSRHGPDEIRLALATPWPTMSLRACLSDETREEEEQEEEERRRGGPSEGPKS